MARAGQRCVRLVVQGVFFLLAATLIDAFVLPDGYPITRIELGEFGVVDLQLHPDAAPRTVANFANLVRTGWYTNSSFYRYEPNYVLQGGGDGGFDDSGVSNVTVPLEYKLPNVNMSVGLARDTAPDTGSSEFFINLENNTVALAPGGKTPDGYCVFASVISGFNTTLPRIEQSPTKGVSNNSFHVFTDPQPSIDSMEIINVSSTCSNEVLQQEIPTATLPRALVATEYGPILLQLRSDAAPLTVANFIRLMKDGFYEDTYVYRYEEGFVFQCGADEFNDKQDTSAFVPLEYCLPNTNRTVGLSRLDAPDSGSSEYFINLADNSKDLQPGGWTVYGYCVFAEVIGGIETMDVLASLPTEQVNKTRFHLFRRPYPKVQNIVLCNDAESAKGDPSVCLDLFNQERRRREGGEDGPATSWSTLATVLLILGGVLIFVLIGVIVCLSKRKRSRRQTIDLSPDDLDSAFNVTSNR